MAELDWRVVPYAELTLDELYGLLDLRYRVFVVEQECAYRDTDGLDQVALHLFGEREGELLAYARLLAPGVAYPEPAIGRVITAPEGRGQGFGKALMERAIAEIDARWPGPIQIGAQRYLDRFYRELGFEPVGEPYLEDGIPHVHMIRA